MRQPDKQGTIYFDETLMGIMDSADVAACIVAAMNRDAVSHMNCSNCGEGVAFDEDGCCVQCGTDVTLPVQP